MLTLFPKFKKRLILFEVLYIALMVVLYILKPGANSIAMLLMLLVGALLCAPLGKGLLQALERSRAGRVCKYILLLAVFALALLALVRSGVNAFIYAQF